MGLLSMTGFGRYVRETPQGRYVVEARSLNNRFLDINLRLPPGMAGLDPSLRDLVRKTVSRGKIDIQVRWEPSEAVAPPPRIVHSTLENLIYQAQEIRRRIPGLQRLAIADFLRVPGVVQEASQEDLDPETTEAITTDIRETVAEALEALRKSRKREGEAIGAALKALHASLSDAWKSVEESRGSVVERYRERLSQRITELLRGSDTSIDPGRLEFEIALFADKADIQEEIDRLRSHLETLVATIGIQDDEPVGRSLDFLVQEMLREVNTIGSKARDLDIANQVLSMKNAVESIKEQVQNVE